MPVDLKRVQSVFLEAVGHTDPADRAGVLDRECADDAELRRRVEALLVAHDQPESLFGWPYPVHAEPTLARTAAGGVGFDADTSADFTLADTATPADGTAVRATVIGPGGPARITEGPGTRIGPYKLLQRIGEGGMGAVYMAEQEQPVRRRVALKIIKPGMDSEQVIGRFEAERQALAMMDHPNIARVLDAGTTDSGRPYFVMELVHGVPITQYCDDARLSPRERLELFVPVCQAIQHAHQKGIIHRDIKPSNMLVTLYDGKPAPKIIDFGIAKATDQQLTERTLFTQFGSIVGTLEYMSPEQAEFSALGVDTRSDIYSLGVVLYELLTGSTPLERERLLGTGYAEILKRIKEEDPPKPSTRLSSSGTHRAAISERRKTEPAKLSRLMRGELDWIVMKALEKDRTRRYETANGFARDIERYLSGDPVEACPPSASYRLRKFARRYRAALAAVSAFAALLVLGAVVSTWQAFRATRAEQKATAEARRAVVAEVRSRRERDRAVAAEAQAKAEGDNARRSAAEACAVLDFFEDHILAAARPQGQEGGLGKDVTLRAAVDAAEPRIAEAFRDQPSVEAYVRDSLGVTYRYLGDPALAIRQQERAVELRKAALGPDHPDTLSSQNKLANVYKDAGRLDLAIPLYERTLAAQTARLGPDHPDLLAIQNNLAMAYSENGRLDRAIPLLERTLKSQVDWLGPDHPDTLTTQNNLALTYKDNGRLDLAIPLLERTLAAWTSRLGPDHPDTLNSQDNLASAYRANGRLDRAIPLLERTLAARTSRLGPDHPGTLRSQYHLALAHKDAGQLDRAIPLFERTLNSQTSRLGPDHPDSLLTQDNLGLSYRDAGQYGRGIALFERTLAVQSHRLGADHPSTLRTQNDLALTFRDDGQYDRAIALFERTLTARSSRLGPDHPDTLLTQHNLAMAYREAGRWDRAIALFERTLALQTSRLGADHPYTLLTQNNLGPAYQAVGQVDRAIALLERTLATRAAKLGADHPSTLSSQNNLALAYQAADRLEQAVALFERTLEVRTARQGADHPRTLTTRYDLAHAYEARGETARAEAMLRDVLAARRKKFGDEHADVAQTLSALGAILLAQQKWVEAEPALREGLAIWDAKRPDAWSRFDTRSRLGESLLGRKKYDEAEPLLLTGYEGLQARASTIPAESKPRLTAAGESVVRLYERWGKPEKAREWRAKLAPPTAGAKPDP
jgi:serine/threonine protein kinase/tetratricopeptide (TPR) repeat protein